MTDPRMNQEPARKPTQEEVDFIVNTAFIIFHCMKAEEISKKSVCAECGSHRGIVVDPADQPDIRRGIVYGKCHKCGATNLIGFYYKTDEELLNSKPRKVFRCSYSNKENPVSVPF